MGRLLQSLLGRGAQRLGVRLAGSAPDAWRMRTVGIVLGILMMAMGVSWALQGVDSEFAPQSFVTGSGAWVVIGLATAGGGTGLVVWSRRRPS